jgi:hypothetical protein
VLSNALKHRMVRRVPAMIHANPACAAVEIAADQKDGAPDALIVARMDTAQVAAAAFF